MVPPLCYNSRIQIHIGSIHSSNIRVLARHDMNKTLLSKLLNAMQAVHVPVGTNVDGCIATDQTSYGFQVFLTKKGKRRVLTTQGFAEDAATIRRSMFDLLVDELYAPVWTEATAEDAVDEFDEPDPVPTSSHDFVADLEKFLQPDAPVAPVAVDLPEGFTAWSGASFYPEGVTPQDRVEVICRGDMDSFSSDSADRFVWLSDADMPHSTDIVGYRLLDQAKETPLDTRAMVIYDVEPDVYEHLTFVHMDGDECYPSALPTTPGIFTTSNGALIAAANPREYIESYQKARKLLFDNPTGGNDFVSPKIVGLSALYGESMNMTYWNPASRPGMTTVTPHDVFPTDRVRTFTLAGEYRECDAWAVDWSHTSDYASNVLAYEVLVS